MKLNSYLIVALALMLLFISGVNASLGTFKQGQCVDIKTSLNATWVNISSINYPNLTTAVSNKAMTKIASTFNYTFCSTSKIGNYIYDYFSDDGNVPYVNNFKITETGEEYDSSQGLMVIAQIGLVGLFLAMAFGFSKEKWKLRTFFFMVALFMGLLVLNSLRVLSGSSQIFSTMNIIGLILGLVVLAFMFLYMMIYYTVEVFKYFKEKRRMRWQVSNQ